MLSDPVPDCAGETVFADLAENPHLGKYFGDGDCAGCKMDDSKTVEAYLESVNASVVEFVRFEVGEGIEKASNDFESEVAATIDRKSVV